MPRPKPNKFQRVIFSIPFLLILAAIVVLVAISAWDMYQTNRESKETVNRLQQEKNELSQRHEATANEALDISTERGLEEEIREKFSVAEEGERVIVLVDDKSEQATTTSEDEPWWQSFLSELWSW